MCPKTKTSPTEYLNCSRKPYTNLKKSIEIVQYNDVNNVCQHHA